MYLSAPNIDKMYASLFLKLKPQQEKKITLWLIFLLLISIAFLIYLDGFLINDVCTGGIVGFELSKTLEIAESYIHSWSVTSKVAAGLV